MFWWRCGDPPPDRHDSTSGGGWKQLKAQPLGEPIRPRKGRQYGNFAQPNGGFGPEIGFARTLLAQSPNRKVAIVKAAFSGTNVSSDWTAPSKANPKGGPCFASMMEEVERAKAEAKREGMELRLRGFLWVQGESDANADAAAKYTDRLSAMVTVMRSHWKSPKLPVLLAVNTRFLEGRNQFMSKIVESQKQVAKRVSPAKYVDTSKASIANPVHFDAAGTLEVGRLFAKALAELEAAGAKTK